MIDTKQVNTVAIDEHIARYGIISSRRLAELFGIFALCGIKRLLSKVYIVPNIGEKKGYFVKKVHLED